MDIGRLLERSMVMSDRVWRRHANPWSVWTRIPILPLLALAIYSRVWVGWWALLPTVLLIGWTFLNPRAFPPPKRFDTWATRGVMGERVWLARHAVPIPREFERIAGVINGLQLVGALMLIYALATLNAWATVAGVAMTMLTKLWFVDRMVWLYDTYGDGRFMDAP